MRLPKQMYGKRKRDSPKQPAVLQKKPPASCYFAETKQKPPDCSSRLMSNDRTPAIAWTLAGMHGETASKNLTDSSSPVTKPYLSTHPFPSFSINHCPIQESGQPFLVLQSFSSLLSSSQINCSMGVDKGSSVQFEDFLPSMARKLGVEGLIQELCKGFQLLMDPRTGKITFQSLKRNAARLGLGKLRDDELAEMMSEGDFASNALCSIQCSYVAFMFAVMKILLEYHTAHRSPPP